MVIEFFLLSFFFIFSYINVSYHHNYKKIIILLIFPVIIISTFRQLGYDLNNYYSIYSDIINLDFSVNTFNIRVGLLNKTYEPVFHVLSHIANSLGLGFRGVLFLYITISFFLLVLGIYLSDSSIAVFISLYFLIAFLLGPYESIRASLGAIAIFISGIFFCKKKYIISVFLFLFSYYSHQSLIIIPLLYFYCIVFSFFKINYKIIYGFLLLAYPLSDFLLSYFIEDVGVSLSIVSKMYSILTRDGVDSFSNNTELLKYLLLIARCLVAYLFVCFINLNIKKYKFEYSSNILGTSEIITNSLAVLSISLLLSNQIVLASRIIELGYVFIIYLLVFIKNNNFKYGFFFNVSCIILLGVNLISAFLMYLLPSGIPI